MSCSICTTASLRLFLTSFAGIDSRSLPTSTLSLLVTNPGTHFYKPRFLHGGPANVKLDSLPVQSQLSSTLDDSFLPFDSTLALQKEPPDGTRRRLFDFSPRTGDQQGNINSSTQKPQEHSSLFSPDDPEPEITLLNPSDVISHERAGSLSTEEIKAISNTTKRAGPTSNPTTAGPDQATLKSRERHHVSKATKSPKDIRQCDGDREPWQIQKRALTDKFGSTGWVPRKRLSPDALEGIRALHAQYPEKYTTPELAQRFQVSPEAIRRILKGKWKPNDEEEEDRRRRWEKRGEAIWSQMVETGIKPPRKWREMGVGRDHVPFRKRRGSHVFDSKSHRHSESGVILFESSPASQRGAPEGRPRVPNRPLSERIL